MRTQIQNDQAVNEVALPISNFPARSQDKDIIAGFDKNFAIPLRLHANTPADSKATIEGTYVQFSDGTSEAHPPLASQVFTVPLSTIDFQTQTTTGATFNVSWPASTVGRFRRVGFSLLSTGNIQAIFSAEVALIGSLANPGSVFITNAIPIGWIDLEATDVSGLFKTAGSSTPIIENEVSGTSRIFRFASGGNGASTSTAALISNNDSTGSVTVLSGTSLINPFLSISAPDTFTVQSSAELVSVDSLTVLGTLAVTGTVVVLGESPIIDHSITGTEIGFNTITGGHAGVGNIALATVTGDLLGPGTGNIAAGTITGGNITGLTITGAHIATHQVTGDAGGPGTGNIALATIVSTNIASATILGSNIAPGTILGSNIASATILGSNIATGTITGFNIDLATIFGPNIASATILGSNIATGTITGSNVVANINLPGDTVQEDGRNVVVCGDNAASSLAIVRLYVDQSGIIQSGEGVSSIIHGGTGNYVVTFTHTFADIPAIIGGNSNFDTENNVYNVSPTGFTIQTKQSGSNADVPWFIIACGRR